MRGAPPPLPPRRASRPPHRDRDTRSDCRIVITALSVNLNKIAVLRNSRGGAQPDILHAARVCLANGAHGITVHPRPDARHVRTDDVLALSALTREAGVEFNLEGNPFAPSRDGYPGFLALCEATRPAQATLVPDGDAQLTSDHGFDFARDGAALRPLVGALRDLGCRVSVFADTGSDVAHAARIGAQRIELYTGPFAAAFDDGGAGALLPVYAETARAALAEGLGVNAGHDLSQANLPMFLDAVPNVLEVSIGHALIGEALYDGMAETVRRYVRIVSRDISG